jgi:hypothetical protein
MRQQWIQMIAGLITYLLLAMSCREEQLFPFYAEAQQIRGFQMSFSQTF